jgi:hypothetical protein
MRRTLIESAKSIAGAGLAAAGMFILYQHVGRAAAHLSHAFGQAGVALPAIVVAAARVAQVYAADYQRFLKDFVMQLLMPSWPLILVMVGACFIAK